MKTNTKTKLKARRMWANYYDDGWCNTFNYEADAKAFASPHSTHTAIPVAVIPLDDVEALVCAAADAYFKAWNYDSATRKEAMRTALAAIGVLPRARKGRK